MYVAMASTMTSRGNGSAHKQSKASYQKPHGKGGGVRGDKHAHICTHTHDLHHYSSLHSARNHQGLLAGDSAVRQTLSPVVMLWRC
jgi:hypothetical protein